MLPSQTALEAAWELVRASESVRAERPEKRKRQGAFYTPRRLAERLAELALWPWLKRAIAARQPDRIAALRILDPAVGGGSLLVATLDLLARAHAAADGAGPDLDDPSPHQLRLFGIPDQGPAADSLLERRRMLSRCLFGVDMTTSALEHTKNALDVLCGAPHRAALEAFDSLLDPWPTRWPPTFDAVVANPPFGTVNRFGRHHPVQQALASHYAGVWQDKLDLAAFFVAASAKRSRVGAFIVPNALFVSDKGRKFRAWLASWRELRLLDARDRFPFPDANVTIGLLHYGRERDPGPLFTPAEHSSGEHDLADEAAEPSHGAEPVRTSEGWLLGASADFDEATTAFARRAEPVDGVLHGPLADPQRWSVVDASVRAAWAHMDRGTKLGAHYHVGKGMETGRNRAFTLSKEALERGLHRSMKQFVRRRIRGVEIAAGRLAPPTQWLIYPEDAGSFDELPEPLQEHLLVYRPVLEARAAHRRGDCAWWRYTWPLHAKRYDQPRVITPYRGTTHRFAPVHREDGIGLTDTTCVFVDSWEEALALSALLCSGPVVRRYAGLTKHTGRGVIEFFENQIREIPLPPRWDRWVQALAALYDSERPAGGPPWDREEVDAMVREAYGLGPR